MAKIRVRIETEVDIDEKVDVYVDDVYDAMSECEKKEMYEHSRIY